jgi:tetratricopeptide (TPR) repeat protein
MKRLILTGILALATGSTALMAQQQQQQQKKSNAPAQPPQQGQPQQQQGGQQMIPGAKTPGESQALIALFQAQGNPDATIKAGEELITKYADTQFKEAALLSIANAYQTKGDTDKAQIFGERVLEVNPKSFQAQLMIGELLAGKTRENDLDKEEKLSKAEKNLNAAIANVNAATKPNPQLTDAQWEEGKKYVIAQAHNGLGMTALVRKKYDVAITEFKAAADAVPEPTFNVRLASAYESAGKHDEAIAVCDKVLADPQLHPQIKQVATNIKNSAIANKK